MDDERADRPYITTYDPFAVFEMPETSALAVYSLDESRTYNQKNYVWHGPISSKTYGVVYNIPVHAKPFGAPWKQAQRMLDQAEHSR